jgi:GxxExxY protein
MLQPLVERRLGSEPELPLRPRHIQAAPRRLVTVVSIFKGKTLEDFRLDLLVGGQVVVELKTVDALLPVHTAQLLTYLKLTRLKRGLLINFNVACLVDGIKRVSL